MGTSGVAMGVFEVEPVTLHRKPFMYTVSRMSEVSNAIPESLPTLGGTAVCGMDPMPGTDATAIWAGRHVFGDLEASANFPDTFVIDTEDGQILRLEAVHVRSVCDGEATTLHVIETLRGNISAVLNHTGGVGKTHGGWRKHREVKSIWTTNRR